MQPMTPHESLAGLRRVWPALFGPDTPPGCPCHDGEQDRQRVAAMALADDFRLAPHLGLAQASEADRQRFAEITVRIWRELERQG